MSALPSPQPGQPPSTTSPIEGMLQAVVRSVKDGTRTAVSTKSEATRIFQWFSARDPGVILHYLQSEAIDIIAQDLQRKLAHSRQAAKRSAFAAYEAGVPPPPTAEVFGRQYFCPDGVWRRAADMTAPDWRYLVEDRAMRARASLFEIELAKRILKKLPNDTTPTGSVVSEQQLERLEQQADTAAEKVYQKLI